MFMYTNTAAFLRALIFREGALSFVWFSSQCESVPFCGVRNMWVVVRCLVHSMFKALRSATWNYE